MNQPVTHLSEGELQQLLDESLSDLDQQRIESHLDSCPTCQERLTSVAGHDNWWNAASSYLGIADLKHETENVDLREVRAIVAPSDDPRMIGRIGTYEVAGVVGSGATGIVVKALDPALNRFVALKLLRPSLAVSSAARARFEREGRAAASIVHENVIAVHGVADVNGVPYLVMPYIAGESLGARIHRCGPMNLDEILRVGLQAACGLAAAHEQGIVHRDVKPGNILLETGVERLKLTDFGLARVVGDTGLTVTGMLAGTPEFMSPEQAMSEQADARSDLFSLGSVLWTMSMGRPPFVGESCYAVIRKIVECNPTPIRQLDPRIPIWWQDLVAKLMHKSPAQRFGSAAELAETLRGCLAHVQDTANPLPIELSTGVSRRSGPSLKTFAQRVSVGWIVGLLMALFVGGSIVLTQWTRSQERGPAPALNSNHRANHSADHGADTIDPFDWDDDTDRSLESVERLLQDLERFDDLDTGQRSPQGA